MAANEEQCFTDFFDHYSVGRMLAKGKFSQVKIARKLGTMEECAVKIYDKGLIQNCGMVEQVKRELTGLMLAQEMDIMHVVRFHEAKATDTEIYFVMELATGGDFLELIRNKGKLTEDEAKKYFEQLILAVHFCHAHGIYHRDLKLENLLLSAEGGLKVSDFGSCALRDQLGEDRLLYGNCGAPAYAAPEVRGRKGYDGAKADIWSCGIILFALMAGYLPFEDSNDSKLYKKIRKADLRFPRGFSPALQKLLKKILDPDPTTRITTEEVMQQEWLRKYSAYMKELDLAFAKFYDDTSATEIDRREQQFMANHNEKLRKIEATASARGFDVKERYDRMNLSSKKNGKLSVRAEIVEKDPSLCEVKIQRLEGDAQDFHSFLEDIKHTLGNSNEALEESSTGAATGQRHRFFSLSCPPFLAGVVPGRRRVSCFSLSRLRLCFGRQ